MPSIKQQLDRVEGFIRNSLETVNNVKAPRTATKGTQGVAVIFTSSRNIAVHVDMTIPLRQALLAEVQSLEEEATENLRRALAIRHAADQLQL